MATRPAGTVVGRDGAPVDRAEGMRVMVGRRAAIAALFSLSLLAGPGLSPAATQDPMTANGCIVTPRKPVNEDGLLRARANAECATELPGREIIVELWQKDSDDTWKLVLPSRTTYIDAGEVFDLSDYDGSENLCRDLDQGRTRKYKTLVRVSDGNGSFTESFSNVEDLGRDCLSGQDDTLISAADDEQVEEIESTAVPGDPAYAVLYNCQIWSYTPHMTNNNTRWEGKASLGCINTYIRRGITVELCENRSQHRNPCGFAEAAYLNKAKYKEFVPWCPVSYPSPPSWVVGYYTRVSFKVKLTNGTNVKDRASSLLRPISKSCFLKQDN